jgi:hypothetical protein
MLIEAFPDFDVETDRHWKNAQGRRPALMALNELSVMSHLWSGYPGWQEGTFRIYGGPP